MCHEIYTAIDTALIIGFPLLFNLTIGFLRERYYENKNLSNQDSLLIYFTPSIIGTFIGMLLGLLVIIVANIPDNIAGVAFLLILLSSAIGISQSRFFSRQSVLTILSLILSPLVIYFMFWSKEVYSSILFLSVLVLSQLRSLSTRDRLAILSFLLSSIFIYFLLWSIGIERSCTEYGGFLG